MVDSTLEWQPLMEQCSYNSSDYALDASISNIVFVLDQHIGIW